MPNKTETVSIIICSENPQDDVRLGTGIKEMLRVLGYRWQDYHDVVIPQSGKSTDFCITFSREVKETNS